MERSDGRRMRGKTLLLTGASRGIGHATVKRFSSAGWRVITCSRQPFPEDCPWEAGPEDHIQVDLADLGGGHCGRGRDSEALERLTDGRLGGAGEQRRDFAEGSAGRRAARQPRHGS